MSPRLGKYGMRSRTRQGIRKQTLPQKEGITLCQIQDPGTSTPSRTSLDRNHRDPSGRSDGTSSSRRRSSRARKSGQQSPTRDRRGSSSATSQRPSCSRCFNSDSGSNSSSCFNSDSGSCKNSSSCSGFSGPFKQCCLTNLSRLARLFWSVPTRRSTPSAEVPGSGNSSTGNSNTRS